MPFVLVFPVPSSLCGPAVPATAISAMTHCGECVKGIYQCPQASFGCEMGGTGHGDSTESCVDEIANAGT